MGSPPALAATASDNLSRSFCLLTKIRANVSSFTAARRRETWTFFKVLSALSNESGAFKTTISRCSLRFNFSNRVDISELYASIPQGEIASRHENTFHPRGFRRLHPQGAVFEHQAIRRRHV